MDGLYKLRGVRTAQPCGNEKDGQKAKKIGQRQVKPKGQRDLNDLKINGDRGGKTENNSPVQKTQKSDFIGRACQKSA